MSDRQRSGTLTFVEEFRRAGRAMVRVRCDCGQVLSVQRHKWRHRPTQSCAPCARIVHREFYFGPRP